MARRPPIDIHRFTAEEQQRRLASGSDAPAGIQWFVDIQIANPTWYRDRSRVRAVIDALASTPWFGEFDVFAPGHTAGTPFQRLDEVRDVIANGETGTAIFAHGEPRMTVDLHETDAALALDVNDGSLVLYLWFGARAVAQYKAAVLGDMIALLATLRDAWPDALVAKALAFPHPMPAVRYRRTRPLKMANRALNAVVDVLDRDVPSDGPPWAREATAMVDAPVPNGVERVERGRLVVVRWIDDPSDPRAMAEACSRHEQWLVPLVPTEIVAGWNEAGDLEVFDQANLVDVSTDDVATWGKPKLGGKPVSLVAASRADALSMVERARAAGFARVLYRDATGRRWDPHPPGDWITDP